LLRDDKDNSVESTKLSYNIHEFIELRLGQDKTDIHRDEVFLDNSLDNLLILLEGR